MALSSFRKVFQNLYSVYFLPYIYALCFFFFFVFLLLFFSIFDCTFYSPYFYLSDVCTPPYSLFQFILSVLSNVYCTLFSNIHLKPFWKYYILAASGSRYLISLHTVYFAMRFLRKTKQNFANIQQFVRTINDSWSQYMREKKIDTHRIRTLNCFP